MLNIGLTKLQLDDAVGGEEIALDGEATNGKDDQTAKEVRKSLITTLRNKFEAGPDKVGNGAIDEAKSGVETSGTDMENKLTPTKKKARASIATSQITEKEEKGL